VPSAAAGAIPHHAADRIPSTTAFEHTDGQPGPCPRSALKVRLFASHMGDHVLSWLLDMSEEEVGGMTGSPPERPRSSPESPPLEFEAPTAAAELHIKLMPAEDLGAGGTAPAHLTRPLITTLGELASLIVGIGGVVLTLRVAPGTTGVAFASAELVLALAVAVLIAVAARGSRRHSL